MNKFWGTPARERKFLYLVSCTKDFTVLEAEPTHVDMKRAMREAEKQGYMVVEPDGITGWKLSLTYNGRWRLYQLDKAKGNRRA